MTEEQHSSKKQYKDFIKEKGFFAFFFKGARKKAEEEKRKKEEEERGRPSLLPTEADKENRSAWPYVVKFVKEFKNQRSRLVLVLVMGIMGNIIGAAFPWTSKFMIDTILPQRDGFLLVAFCLLLFFIGLCDVILKNFQDYITHSLVGNFTVQIKRRLMSHLQKMPLVYLQELKVGGITSRLQQDTERMSNLLILGLISPFNAILMFVVALTSLFILSWRVSIVCIIFSLFIGLIAYIVFNVMRPFHNVLREDNAIISAKVTEAFSGVKVVRSFCRETTFKLNYSLGVDLLWRKLLYGHAVGITIHRTLFLIFYMLQIFIWGVGGYSVIQGKMTIGDVVVFISFMSWIFNPIFRIMFSFSEIQQSLACTERTFDLLDIEPDIVDKTNAREMDLIREGLELKEVSFRYPDAPEGEFALKNISLKIPKGKVTALVGPSGGGKTTLVNLVLRFYDVTEGKLFIDDVDIKDIKIGSFRRLTSLVLQEVFLFDGTIRENIAFGKKNASLEEIKQAAKVAHCQEFIDNLEKKYDTLIGERGVKLSGGQKQRIALARAILTDPHLLILDEATSNLDSESEGLIQDALTKILKQRTTIAIAHRLSTIMDADNIVVIEKGELVEQGSHIELLEKKGRYFEMYNKQMEKAKQAQNYWEFGNGNGNGEPKQEKQED